MRDVLARPVGFRANGRLIRCTKHTEFELEPVIRTGERIGGFMAPDQMVALKITVRGLRGDPQNGRCEFWVPRDDGRYWYFHYESVEWEEQFGVASRNDAGRIGGFMAVDKRLQGLRDYKRLFSDMSGAKK